MKKKGGPDNEYSMCVLGIRKPTCKEAEEFFRADIITILIWKKKKQCQSSGNRKGTLWTKKYKKKNVKRVELFLYLIEAMESIALAAVAILIGSNRKSNDRYEKILRNMDMEQHRKKLKIFAKSVERSSSLMYILKIFVAKSVDQLIGLSIHFVVIVTSQ